MNVTDENDRLVRSEGIDLLMPVMTVRFGEVLIAQSTRRGGVSAGNFGMNTSYRVGDEGENVTINRGRFFRAAGIPAGMVATAGQVHGTVINRADAPGHFTECDGFITDRKNLFLSVTVADCLPVYFFDPVRRAIGIVHAGWRGTREGVAAKCVELMSDVYSSRPEDIRVYIGPGARHCCYEIGPDLADRFPPEHLRPRPRGKFLLDLPSFNRSIVLRTGVPESQIDISSHCTIHEKELFHSYRRDGDRSGRMMGVIGLR